MLGHICSVGKVFKIFRVMTIFGRLRDPNRKKPNPQTAYSFGYSKQCEYLMTIKMQNLTY